MLTQCVYSLLKLCWFRWWEPVPLRSLQLWSLVAIVGSSLNHCRPVSWLVGNHWTYAEINCYYGFFLWLLSTYQQWNKTLLCSLSSRGGFRKQQVQFTFIYWEHESTKWTLNWQQVPFRGERRSDTCCISLTHIQRKKMFYSGTPMATDQLNKEAGMWWTTVFTSPPRSLAVLHH